MRSVLARFVALLHTALVVFVCVAWAFPWNWAIWSILILYPLARSAGGRSEDAVA